MNKVKIIAVYALMGLTTFAFGAAGIFKLLGTPELHLSFAKLGLPEWFGYFIGAAEIAGAIGIWFKRVATPAAAGLAIIMLGAIYYHVTFDPMQQAIPAVVLFIFTASIALIKRKHAIWVAAAV